MQPFDLYFKTKMKDSAFKTLYEAECHVCANTVRIFEKADLEHISMESLARDVQADVEEVKALQVADRCDPHLVVRLCKHLGLRLPENCSKLSL